MAASTAAIANLALSHLGSTAVVITDLAADTTLEGKSCRQFYSQAVRETLLAHPWNVAQVQAALTLVEAVTTDPMEWAYKYRVPEDCLMPQRVLWQNIRTPPSGYRVPYRLLRDTESTTYNAATAYVVGDYVLSATIWYRCILAGTGQTPVSSPTYWTATATYSGVPPQWLLCDAASAWLEYTVDLTDPRDFTPDLDNAVAARLAFYVAPKLALGNPNVRGEMAGLWDFLIRAARANDANNEQRDPEPPSSFEMARLN